MITPMIRIIYALHFEITPTDHGELRCLVAWLTPDGNSPTLKPVTKNRVIDLRVGDELFHRRLGTQRIQKIESFRDRYVTHEQWQRETEGYAVVVKNPPILKSNGNWEVEARLLT